MSSDNRRVVFNTRERILSNDMNNATALLNAKGTDEVASTLQGDRYDTANAVSGIFAGGLVTANGTNEIITITPMIGYKFGTGATALDSDYLKVESTAAIEVDLSPFVDGANPRWVAIEVAPSSTAELVNLRDIFQPATGTFTVAPVTKIQGPDPIVTVNAGVASPSPQLPFGNPDVIPLAYVYLEAGATQIDQTDVIFCRPRLTSQFLGPTVVQGGGLEVINTGTTLAEIQSFRFRSFQNGNPLVSSASPNVDFNLAGFPNYFVGEQYPVPGNQEPLYAYAINPPYPPGYDTDCTVSREFVDLSGRIPSNPVTPFPAVFNGLVMLSTQPPLLNNEIGAHPSPTVQVNDSTWNGGNTTTSVFIGAVYKSDILPPGLAVQRAKGNRIEIIDPDKSPSDRFQLTGLDSIGPFVGLASNASPFLLNADGKGVFQALPPAFEYLVRINYLPAVLAAPSGNFLLQASEDVPPAPGLGTFEYTVTNAAPIVFNQEKFIRTNTAGQFTVDAGTTSGTLNIVIQTTGYLDPVISQR